MFKYAVSDLASSIWRIDVAAAIAWNDLRARFERTLLGPFWIVISNVMLVAGITVVFGALFNNPIQEYVVYVSLGITVWTFLSSIVSEGPNYLYLGRDMLFTFSQPWSLQILRRIILQVIILLLHIFVFAAVILLFQVELTPYALLSVLGIIINIVFAYGLSLGLSAIGSRYRDLSHALGSVMVFLFLFTPVFWNVEALGEARFSVVMFNPFYHLIEVVRGPIVSPGFEVINWVVASFTALITLLVGISVYVGRRKEMAAWLQ